MINNLMMFNGVTKVSPIGSGYEDDLNRQRVKRELLDNMRALLGEEWALSSVRVPPSWRRSSAAKP